MGQASSNETKHKLSTVNPLNKEADTLISNNKSETSPVFEPSSSKNKSNKSNFTSSTISSTERQNTTFPDSTNESSSFAKRKPEANRHQKDQSTQTRRRNDKGNPNFIKNKPQTKIDLAKIEYEQGERFFENGEFTESKEHYSRAIDILPKYSNDRIPIFLKRAIVLEAKGEYLACLKDCGATIRRTYTSIKKKHRISHIMKKNNSSFSSLLMEALFLEADVLRKLNRHGEAILVYEEILTQDPSLNSVIMEHTTECKAALKKHGNSLVRKKKYREAEKAYTEVIKFVLPKKDGDLVLLLSNRSEVLRMMNEYKECLKDCNAAINLIRILGKNATSPLIKRSGTTMDRIFGKVQLRKAHSLEALEQFYRAFTTYREIVKIDFVSQEASEGLVRCKSFVHMEQGTASEKEGDYEEAVRSYTSAIKSLPDGHGDKILFLKHRKDVFLKQSNFSEGLEDCKLAAAIAKQKVQSNDQITPLMKKAKTTYLDLLLNILRAKAVFFEKLHQYENAARTYMEIETFSGSDEERAVFMNYKKQGNSYFKKGDYKKAQELYTKAIKSLPSDHLGLTMLLNNRAASLLKQCDYKKCLADAIAVIELVFSKFYDIDPNTPFMTISMTTIDKQLTRAFIYKATAYEKLKSYEKAIRVYEEIGRRGTDTKSDIKRCRKLLDKEAEEIRSKKERELYEQEEKKKADEAMEDYVNEKIDEWSKLGGVEKSFKSLLSTVDTILWPEIQLNCNKISNSSTKAECKAYYRRLILKVHPDKLPKDSTAIQCMLANRIFITLDKSWKLFEKLE